MTKQEAVECAKNMTYREAVRNTFYAKGVKYKKATRIKLHELAEIADKIDTTIESSDDLISRAKVLALINKAMDNTDNKDIQDYLFNGLRRDVHSLPSSDRQTGEWIQVDDKEPLAWDCSVCGAMCAKTHNYCPCCGARMKGEVM